ncbi:hypothetical protein LSAT2_002948 [Lamellibrachia satsuma]|nr:hypothetical protein LSAT2_002948 [Lamellibrachia satsuma]
MSTPQCLLPNVYSTNVYSASVYSANVYSANVYSANVYSTNVYSTNVYSAIVYSANVYSASVYSANVYSTNVYSASVYPQCLLRQCLLPNVYSANVYSPMSTPQCLLPSSTRQCLLPNVYSPMSTPPVSTPQCLLRQCLLRQCLLPSVYSPVSTPHVYSPMSIPSVYSASVYSPVSTPQCLLPSVYSPMSTPPVSTPPVSTPPVSTPPVSTPPVSTPPVSTPPMSTPPMSTPPLSTPPMSTPPVSTPPLCISLNNIEHVRQFLDELHQLLDWNTVTQQMALKHESEEIGQKALTTLEQLVDGANEDMLMKSRQLLRQIADKMTVDLQAYFAALMKSKPETAAIDPLLDYLDTNLGMFYERLEAALFPLILEHIWDATIEVFHEMLLVGQSPEYYKQMLSHLQLIEAYFNNEGTSSSCWTDSSLYGQLVEKLQLNSLSSEQLMLLYYEDLAESPTTPREYYGHLGVKIGFISKTADCVSLHIKVLHASHLPTMKPNGMCDAYVTVSLGPSTLFPFNRPMRTQVVYGCSSPLFHEIFQFKSIPRSLLSTEGTVVVFSVWQHKTFLPHDFLGEVVLSLSDATEIGRLETIDDTCGVMMPLKRPMEPRDGPFQVLRERCQRDKVASSLVKCRRSMAGGGRTLCAPMHFILSSVCGNIKNVKHVFS